MIPNALASANQGIQHNLQRFSVAAGQIANPDSNAGVEEIVAMKQAELGLEVNVAVFKKINQMSDHLLDMLV